MSRWDETFEAHAVFGALDGVRAVESSADVLEDADETEQHGRIGRVVDYVESALKACDPDGRNYSSGRSRSG